MGVLAALLSAGQKLVEVVARLRHLVPGQPELNVGVEGRVKSGDSGSPCKNSSNRSKWMMAWPM